MVAVTVEAKPQALLNARLAQTATASTVVVIEAPAFATEQADRGVAFQESPTLPPPESYSRYLKIIAELDATYNARQCVIDHESREAGMYTAENNISSASGAYQWLNRIFSFYLPRAEAFYGFKLTSPEEDARGARWHAAYSSPFVQDLVAAFALEHRDLAQNQKPWPYSLCWSLVGTVKQLRPDGPENWPTPYVLSQMV